VPESNAAECWDVSSAAVAQRRRAPPSPLLRSGFRRGTNSFVLLSIHNLIPSRNPARSEGLRGTCWSGIERRWRLGCTQCSRRAATPGSSFPLATLEVQERCEFIRASPWPARCASPSPVLPATRGGRLVGQASSVRWRVPLPRNWGGVRGEDRWRLGAFDTQIAFAAILRRCPTLRVAAPQDEVLFPSPLSSLHGPSPC